MIKSINNILIISVVIYVNFFSPFTLNAQNLTKAKQLNHITLKVSGDGCTKEEAINNALRSAVEQACGAFVSSNTTIINDELAKDDIVTLSSGNVNNYSEISSIVLPNNRHYVLIEATVSLTGIAKYVEAKGETVNFNGNSFAATMALRELNADAEKKVASNLLTQVNEMAASMYDISLEIKEPKLSNGEYIIPMIVSYTRNSNTKMIFDYIFSTLSSISLTNDEIEGYASNDLPVYHYLFGVFKAKNILGYEADGFSAYCINSEMDPSSHNSGVVEIKKRSLLPALSKDVRILTSQLQIGVLFQDAHIHYTYTISKDKTYDYLIRFAFRNNPDWLNSIGEIIVTNNISFSIVDNLGNTYNLASPNICLNDWESRILGDMFRGAYLPSLIPLQFDFHVSKEEISKISSFSIQH